MKHTRLRADSRSLSDDIVNLCVTNRAGWRRIGADEFTPYFSSTLSYSATAVFSAVCPQGRQQGVDLVAPLGLLGDNPSTDAGAMEATWEWSANSGSVMMVAGLEFTRADLQALGARHPARLSPR